MTELIYKELSHSEQRLVLPLLGKCFPAYWEQRALTLQEFPFHEISFAALDGDRIVGHCGVIPYQISDGKGSSALFGGIASVAVDPDYRKRGIARRLCLETIPWAHKQNMDSLTLYTEYFPVYQSAGWQRYKVPTAASFSFNRTIQATAVKRPVTSLSEAERNQVQSLYLASEDFLGKVLRGNGHEFNSWKRLLNDPDYDIVLSKDFYTLFCDNVIIEVGFPPDADDDRILDSILSCAQPGGTLDVLLPDTTRAWKLLSASCASSHPSPIDAMHGERPMFLDVSSAQPHAQDAQIFYPIADKF